MAAHYLFKLIEFAGFFFPFFFFFAVHMASCIFSIFTSPNRVHKTTVKQMVISPGDSLTFEKQTCDWKDYNLNLKEDWKLNKEMSSCPA